MKKSRITDSVFYGVTCLLLVAVGVVIGADQSRSLEDLSNASSVISMLIAFWASVFALKTVQSWKQPLAAELHFEILNASKALELSALTLHVSIKTLFFDNVLDNFLKRKLALTSVIDGIRHDIYKFQHTRLSVLAGRDSRYMDLQRLTDKLKFRLFSIQNLLDKLNVADSGQFEQEESEVLDEASQLCLMLSQEVQRFHEASKEQLFILLSNRD
ncbi:MAG: hypothetical protein KKF22_00035 [Gammaproteobacteria bacterium]|nr:hypothetical protein [Gammaproteobacteria bacterium]